MEEQAPAVAVKEAPKISPRKVLPFVAGSVLVVLAGIGAGWFISGGKLAGMETGQTAPSVKGGQMEAGVKNGTNFKDEAEGQLAEGGIEGEGTHHLVRDGGPSQYVYLTSTVIDLQGFVGKKVKVWGETISGRKAGWLMDVGKIKVQD